MHFYYFAVLAMLSGFCDWRVLVVAAGLVALHHLTLDLVLPNAVYPGASDLKRVAVHAVVVVIETAMLIFIGRAIIAAFEAARRNGTDAERLAGDLHRLVAERERDLSDTVSQANAVGAAVDRFQAEIGDAVRLLQDAATALGATPTSSARSRFRPSSGPPPPRRRPDRRARPSRPSPRPAASSPRRSRRSARARANPPSSRAARSARPRRRTRRSRISAGSATRSAT